jgi:hypothetical protein
VSGDPVLDFLLRSGFVVGAIMGNLLLVQYWVRSNWRSTPTGKVMFALFAVIAASYDLSVLAIFWPDFFDGMTGMGIRIGARWVINIVLIALYVLLLRAQRNGRDATPSVLSPHEE